MSSDHINIISHSPHLAVVANQFSCHFQTVQPQKRTRLGNGESNTLLPYCILLMVCTEIFHSGTSELISEFHYTNKHLYA